jgi:hypothetical protein
MCLMIDLLFNHVLNPIKDSIKCLYGDKIASDKNLLLRYSECSSMITDSVFTIQAINRWFKCVDLCMCACACLCVQMEQKLELSSVYHLFSHYWVTKDFFNWLSCELSYFLITRFFL